MTGQFILRTPVFEFALAPVHNGTQQKEEQSDKKGDRNDPITRNTRSNHILTNASSATRKDNHFYLH
jgi:hypothetical protein